MMGVVAIYKRLIIIGNGFDLFHGIKSTYKDFQNFIYQNASKEFIESIEKYILPEELWNQFEKALGDLEYEELLDYHSDSLVSYGADNWSDSYHHDYQYLVDSDLAFSKDISQYLSKWINSIDTDVVERRLKRNYLTPNSLYLCFNYTDTLENVYGIERGQILYLHGKAMENCKRQLLFHKYRQLIFHKKRQLKFHTYRNHFIFCKFHFVCGFMENSA